MWERHTRIILVVGSDSLDGSPPKHNSCCLYQCVHTFPTHTRLKDALFVFSGTLSGASVHPSDVLSFKSDGVISSRSGIEVLSADERNFLGFL